MPHIRIGLSPRVLCKAPSTKEDLTLREAYEAIKNGQEVCPHCVEKVNQQQVALNELVDKFGGR